MRIRTSWFEVFKYNVTLDSKFPDKPERTNKMKSESPYKEQQTIVYILSTFFFSKIYSDAFLISAHASPPWADTVNIKLSPDTQRVSYIRRLNLNNFGSKMPVYHSVSRLLQFEWWAYPSS